MAGKIIFTEYQAKKCALLIRNNRLLAAQVMNDAVNRIGAVYIGKIKNVVKNIDAYFLEIADGEICFLAAKDTTNPIILNRKYDGRILEGDEILVQLVREAQKTKQASVTANISLANQYAAIDLSPGRVGFSSKLANTRKAELKAWLAHAELPDWKEYGLVIRTQATDCAEEALLQHIGNLIREFQSMLQIAPYRTCFSCIRQAPADFEAILNQLAYSHEYEEILTDDITLYNKLAEYCRESMPDKSVRLYEDSSLSLSKLYSIEQKMDTALNRRIWLKSGGYLIIDPTEAMTVIDVNSGKYEATRAKHGRAEDTFQKINQEAVEEIALQLRLRNLSGIILVDFINMSSQENNETLLNNLRNLVHSDRVKTRVIDMTALGLVEITRQKQNKPLREQLM